MSYRFVPWVRRGLAAEINEIDNPGAPARARATFPVTININESAGQSERDIQLYGPGDVIGIDTRQIVRVEPKPDTPNFAPDQFAAVEFDTPDFPWLFTPAAANADDQLRPWLVLVVVTVKDGVSITVGADQPLPQLTIEAAANPAEELPDLAESWAWAHTQLVEGASPTGSVAARVAADPDRNISRLMCPRRLVENTDYYACLVPAFASGRQAGLGQAVDPDATTTGPAWSGDGKVILPLYYHWRFRTGLAGDFESLARKLKPTELPDGVGLSPMFIGNADPALPTLPATAEAGGIIEMEGALRAPDAGSGAALDDRHDDLVAALARLLDAPAEALDSGPSSGLDLPAETVAPPLYGAYHVRQHRVPAQRARPRWFRDLNADPRHRAAAGLGAAVIKANQERFMDAAWDQIGDVLAANQSLNLARLAQLVNERILERHFVPLSPHELLAMTTPMHGRTMADDQLFALTVDTSLLPGGATDPAFRRMVSPRGAVLRRAARLAGGPGGAGGAGGAGSAAPVDIGVIDRLAVGELPVDLDRIVDGLAGSTLVDRLPEASGGLISGEPLGLPGSIPATAVTKSVEAAATLAAIPVGKISLRTDIAGTGVVIDRQFERLATALPVEGTSLRATIGEVLVGRRDNREAIGFLVPDGRAMTDDRVDSGTDDDRRSPALEALELDEEGRIAAIDPRGRRRQVLAVAPEVLREIGPVGVGEMIGALPPGMIDPSGSGPMVPNVGVEVGGTVIEPFEPIPSGEPVITIEPPVTDPAFIATFVEAHKSLEAAAAVIDVVVSARPAPEPLNLAGAHAQLVQAIDPRPTTVARITDRIAVGADRTSFADLVELSDRFHQEEELGYVMVGPRFNEALYRALADYDQDRFLPGADAIPANAITVLETNPRFVEAFLVGANHEMNHELLWRGYPTNRRDTVFRRFWERLDTSTDIGPIHGFRSAVRLGTNSNGDIAGSLVLLLRGDLLRRYPNSVVYAVPALAGNPKTIPSNPDPDQLRIPVFSGTLEPDITFVGFDLTREDVDPEPGWFFVIQEQPTEPRFGLDVGGGEPPGPPSHWADLTWDRVGVAKGRHLPLDALRSANIPLVEDGTIRARWKKDAAHMAAITFQRPFRAAIHSSEVLG